MAVDIDNCNSSSLLQTLVSAFTIYFTSVVQHNARVVVGNNGLIRSFWAKAAWVLLLTGLNFGAPLFLGLSISANAIARGWRIERLIKWHRRALRSKKANHIEHWGSAEVLEFFDPRSVRALENATVCVPVWRSETSARALANRISTLDDWHPLRVPPFFLIAKSREEQPEDPDVGLQEYHELPQEDPDVGLQYHELPQEDPDVIGLQEYHEILRLQEDPDVGFPPEPDTIELPTEESVQQVNYYEKVALLSLGLVPSYDNLCHLKYRSSWETAWLLLTSTYYVVYTFLWRLIISKQTISPIESHAALVASSMLLEMATDLIICSGSVPIFSRPLLLQLTKPQYDKMEHLAHIIEEQASIPGKFEDFSWQEKRVMLLPSISALVLSIFYAFFFSIRPYSNYSTICSLPGWLYLVTILPSLLVVVLCTLYDIGGDNKLDWPTLIVGLCLWICFMVGVAIVVLAPTATIIAWSDCME